MFLTISRIFDDHRQRLIKEGHATCIVKTDMTAKLLRPVIQTYTAKTEEETDLMNVLYALSPSDASDYVKMRVAAIVVEKLGIFI